MPNHEDELLANESPIFPTALFRGRVVNAEYYEQIVPSYIGNPLIEAMPEEFENDKAAAKALMQRPNFSPQLRNLSPRDRIHCIGDLEDQFFQPLSYHLNLQLKISRMIRRGYVMRNPILPGFYQQLQQTINSVPSFIEPIQLRRPKALGFNLIGPSGIGKSYSLESILFLYPQLIRHHVYKNRRFTQQQLTWLKLDCPFDGSPRGLGLDFLQAVDDVLGTNYKRAYGTKASVDDLVRAMARVAALHFLGALVIDEIQVLRAIRGENSERLLNFFVNLVNTIGVPVLLVGTDKARQLFESKPRQARRGTGQGAEVWYLMRNDEAWRIFLTALFKYQYVQQPVELTDELLTILFEETQGVTDLVVKLYVQSQIRAIRTGDEHLTPGIIRSVALDSFQMLRPVIIALRKGDKRALAELEDIYPFWREEYARLLQQEDEPIDVRGSSKTETRATCETVVDPETGSGKSEELNIQPKAQVDNPANTITECPSYPRRAKGSYPQDSLMAVIERAKVQKTPPYQALQQAGYIFSLQNYVTIEEG